MRGNKYQIALILLLVVTTILFGIFWFRELFPEYKIYQEAFQKIEVFRLRLQANLLPPLLQGLSKS